MAAERNFPKQLENVLRMYEDKTLHSISQMESKMQRMKSYVDRVAKSTSESIAQADQRLQEVGEYVQELDDNFSKVFDEVGMVMGHVNLLNEYVQQTRAREQEVDDLRLKGMVRSVIEEFDIPQHMQLMQKTIDGLAERVARWEPRGARGEGEGDIDWRIHRVDDTVKRSRGRMV